MKRVFLLSLLLFPLSFLLSTSATAADPADKVKIIHQTIEDYEVTCADTPVVEVVRNTCSTDAGGDGPPYGSITNVDPLTGQDYIDMKSLVSLVGTKLGGYGPDEATIKSTKTDALNRIYPYYAFIGKSLLKSADKETYGSFWKLTGLYEILNSRAKLIKSFLTQNPPMTDQDISYAGNTIEDEKDADGTLVAKYMNAIIDGVAGDPKIKLLSPAFNMTSSLTPPLVKQMFEAGAKFGSLSACAGNVYTTNQISAHDWYTNFLSATGLTGKCNFLITEFGDFDTFTKKPGERPTVINKMYQDYNATIADPSVLGAIYFNALGGNPAFTGHKLLPEEYRAITANNPTKSGVNSAMAFSNGQFPLEASDFMKSGGFILEIAFSSGDAQSAANSINAALSKGLTTVVRICAGNTCSFSKPESYISFLKDVSSKVNGPFYAIAGPNEPEAERWLEPIETVAYSINKIKLSKLVEKLPGCLTSYPVCDGAVDAYNQLEDKTKIQYDALIPFNQDSFRGYLGLDYLSPPNNQNNFGIISEGLSYISPIISSLIDENFGFLRSLSPQWLNQKRAEILTSDQYFKSEGEKDDINFIKQIANRAKNIWISETYEDKPKQKQFGCFTHDQGLTLPAPTTFPQDLTPNNPPKNLSQYVRVPVKTTETENSSSCPIRDKKGNVIGYGTRYETRMIPGGGLRDPNNYVVSNIGRGIAVLNNPKMTDISRLVSEPKGDKDYSLSAQLLPSSDKKTSDFIDLPLLSQGGVYESEIVSGKDGSTQNGAKAGNTATNIGVIARKGGGAQVDLCKLRNYWLVPQGQQAGTPNSCEASISDAGRLDLPSRTTGKAGTCEVPQDPNLSCSPNNTTNSLKELFGDQADNAAAICTRESNGYENALNTHCLDADPKTHTVDYSVGLFQINMLAHPNPAFFNTPDGASLAAVTGGRPCYEAFSNYTDYRDYSKWGNACVIGNPSLLNACVTWFQVAKNNLAYAKFLVTGGSGTNYDWSPWSTATGCNIK